MSTHVELDVEGLITAIVGGDRDYQHALFAEDAEVVIFDADTAQEPQLLVGKTAIATWLDRTCRRSATHRVVDLVVDGDLVSWTDHCRTSEGLNIVYQNAAELRGGLIAQQSVTVVWEDLPDY